MKKIVAFSALSTLCAALLGVLFAPQYIQSQGIPGEFLKAGVCLVQEELFGKIIVDCPSYGAKGDWLEFTDGAIDIGTDATLLTSAGETICDSALDPGKLVHVHGAGASGAEHSTTIASCSSGAFVMTDDALTSVSGALFQYGTNNRTAYDAVQTAIENANCDVTVVWPQGAYWATPAPGSSNGQFVFYPDCQITGTGVGGGPGLGNLRFIGDHTRLVQNQDGNQHFIFYYMKSLYVDGFVFDGNNRMISSLQTSRGGLLRTIDIPKVKVTPNNTFIDAAGTALATYTSDDSFADADNPTFDEKIAIDVSGTQYFNIWETCYVHKGFNFEGAVILAKNLVCYMPQTHQYWNGGSNITSTLGPSVESDGNATTANVASLVDWSGSYIYYHGGGPGPQTTQNAKCFGINLANTGYGVKTFKADGMTCETDSRSRVANIILGDHDVAGDVTNVSLRGIDVVGDASANDTFGATIVIAAAGTTNRKVKVTIDGFHWSGQSNNNSNPLINFSDGDFEYVYLNDIQMLMQGAQLTDLVRFAGSVKYLRAPGLGENGSNRGQTILLTNGEDYGLAEGVPIAMKRTVAAVGEAVDIGTFLAESGFGAASPCMDLYVTVNQLPKAWSFCSDSTDTPGWTYAAPRSNSSTGTAEGFDYDLHLDPGTTGSVLRLRLFTVKGTPSDTEYRIVLVPWTSRHGTSVQYVPVQFTPSTTAAAVSWPEWIYWGTFSDRATYRRIVNASEIVTAGLNHDTVIVKTLPQQQVTRAFMDVTTGYTWQATFSGTLDQDLGSSAGGQEILNNGDVTSTALYGDASGELGSCLGSPVQGGCLISWSASGTLTLRTTSGTSNLGNGTATNLATGQTVVYVKIEKVY